LSCQSAELGRDRALLTRACPHVPGRPHM